MGESEGKSRRNVLAVLVVLVVGAARFGEDVLRALAKGRHPLRALVHSADESTNGTNNQQREDGSVAEGFDTDDTESLSQLDLWSVDTEITVESSTYTYWDFDLEEGSSIGDNPIMNYDILLREGPNIDFFVLEEEEFEAFERGEAFRYHPASETDTWRVDGRSQLDRKKYYIVIENPIREINSSDSSSIPDSSVSVEISFENR